MDNSFVRFLRFLLWDLWPITLTMSVSLAAIYLLLPRPRPVPRLWGAAAAGLALLLAGILIVRADVLAVDSVLFYGFAAIAVVSGGLLVTQSNPARAALSFAVVVLSTCGLFLLLAAPFLMAASIIIYAGAIIVTFLFVLMLAQQEGCSDADQRSREPLLASLAGFVLLGALLYVLQMSYGTRDIDLLLGKVQQAQTRDTLKDMAAALGDDTEFQQVFFNAFKQAVLRGGSGSEARNLAEAIENVQLEWVKAGNQHNVQAGREVWQKVETIGRRARNSFGVLQPAGDVPLSAFSGPPANLDLGNPAPGEDGPPGPALRRNEKTGWPEMPAENTAYLGRALFTDNLLAVELGGTLLLVATIGAIAIAGRAGGNGSVSNRRDT
jgi:NADH:ubiquinone oxidoreductase subunit 6 (subunit J)